MNDNKMTPGELRATWGLGTVFSLRMLGMFMVLPVLTTYGMALQGASEALIGLAIGIYGLAQAVFQIPFGLLSDRIGRKPLIVGGLLIFVLGSVIAALTDSIWGIILGRALQGSGAIAAAVMALLSDLTREQNRTKAMAFIGVSFGVTFAIAMVLAVAVTVMRVSPLKPLRVFGDLYVQVFRNIPGIALLIIVVYALPPLKVVLPYRTCVIVATVLLGSAFGSENFMSGINTVGVGQVEAARSLGMSFSRILAKIVIPQALRSSVLPMTNLFIAVMLTTALGSQVPLKPQELTGVVSYINTRSLGGVAAFFISALGYLGTAFVVSHIGNYIDKKVRILR